jgi:hypothetical protein
LRKRGHYRLRDGETNIERLPELVIRHNLLSPFFTLILPPDAEHVYDDAGQFGNCVDWMEPRIHAIQVISNYSVLHFYFEIITGWSGICIIKRLEMQGRSRPPAAV